MALAVTMFRFLLGFVFLSASVPKLRHMSDFERTVARYELLPSILVRPVSRLLPPLECASAILLFAGIAVSLVSAAVGVLLTCFAVAVAVNLLRGRRIDCGCSGPGTTDPIGWLTVLRNLVLAGVAAVAFVRTVAGQLVVGVHARSSSALPWSSQIATLLTVASALMVLALARQGLDVRTRLSRSPEIRP